MTDIRRQIVPLIKLITQALSSVDSVRLLPDERASIVAQIRELLPDSYGIGVGCVIDARGKLAAESDALANRIADTILRRSAA